MPSNTEPRLLIVRLALATYGVRLGDTSMSTTLSSLAQAGGADALMNALYARDLGRLSLADAAARIVDNIGITGTARADAVAYLAERLSVAPPTQRGQVIVETVDLLAGLANDAKWGTWATQFNAEVARLEVPGVSADSYVRNTAAAQGYAAWIPPAPAGDPPGGGGGSGGGGTGGGGTGGGGTGGGGTGGGGTGGGNPGSLLDIKSLSDSIAAAIGNDSLPSEGLEIVLSRSPSTRYLIDKNNNGTLGDDEITTVMPTLGIDSVLSGSSNDRLTLTQHQLRTNAQFDLGAQQDNVVPGRLREGADTVTLVHADMNNDGVVEAADAPWRPTLTLQLAGTGELILNATGGALFAQKTKSTFRNVEQIDIQQAATSNRFDDSLDVSASASGVTVNMGEARAVGANYGGGQPATTVARLDGNSLASGALAPVGDGLGREWIEIAGLAQVERITGSGSDDRVIVAADAAMQTVGTGAFAPAATPLRTRFEQSTASTGGFSSTPSLWEDQGLYRFDLAAGTGDALDFAGETLAVSVSVNTAPASVDRVFIGAPGAGGGRVDIATNVERYFGGAGNNWIDLAAASVATTIEFSRRSGVDEWPEPDGQAIGALGLTRGAEVRNAGDGTVYASFVDRTGAGALPAAAWSRLQGSVLAETVIFTDGEVGVAHQLRLAGGANRLDYSALSHPIAAALGAVDVLTAALVQNSTASDDSIQQFLGANQSGDILSLTASRAAGDLLDITALAHGIVTVANPDTPTTSQVDPAFHLVDLTAGIVIESVFGQYRPVTSPALIVSRAFVTRISSFESASNAGDANAVHLIGSGLANTLIGGSAGDVLLGDRGVVGSGGVDAGLGFRGDRLTGGGGADLFFYRNETESPGGTIAGGQQLGGLFGGNELNVTNSRDTITDFAPGVDKLMFAVTDAYDSLRPIAPMPASIAATLNAAVPLAAAFAADTTTVDIGKTAALAGTVDDFDNYRVDNIGATLSIADLALRVMCSAGANIIDASAGLATGALNAASNDGLRVDLVYTAANQSQGLSHDQIVHFRSGSDRIDLSFLKVPRMESAREGNGVAFDVNGNNVVDALESGLVRQLAPAQVVISILGAAPSLFIDNGVWRPVAAQAQPHLGGTSTMVFIDADADGNYNPSADMVLVLVGINAVANGDFVVDQYGGLWGG